MSSQVVTCWNCQREFEATLEKKPPTRVYRGTNPDDATDATKDKSKAREIARPCPYCEAINIILGKEE